MATTKVGFVSLGCPKNQIDTEIMLHHLVEAGYEIAAEDIDADIIIVNTCAFIESAKQEAIDNILDVAWLKQKKLKGLIVTGCLAQRYRDEIQKEMPEVDAVLGVGALHEIVTAVKEVEAGRKFSSYPDPETMCLGGERVVSTPEYLAYLKVAEGCDNRCAYCAIPGIRGRFRSRPTEDLVEEAKSLEALGVKELVIVAQDTSRYGLDLYGEYRLPELLRAITEATQIPWIRLLYCYPDKITDALIAEIRDNPRIVKYIDLPIQHISDRVLKNMNRHGDGAMIRSAVNRLREAIPDIVIRTTAIVGFPGETDEEFAELCQYIKDTKFERFGAFPYSQEEDTPAAEMPDQIDEQVKQDRYDRIMEIQLDIAEAYNQKQMGKTVTVLCEGYDPVAETYYGRSAADAPEIDGKIYFSAKRRISEGEFVPVRIKSVQDYDLIGLAL